MRFLDNLPLPWLVFLALWMARAPITPEPHLLEKIRMLSLGGLSKPIDIFDLLMHTTPLLLLLLRLWRQFRPKHTEGNP